MKKIYVFDDEEKAKIFKFAIEEFISACDYIPGSMKVGEVLKLEDEFTVSIIDDCEWITKVPTQKIIYTGEG